MNPQLLPERDIGTRIEELRSIKNGWLDGKGIAPDQTALDWVSKQFHTNYPEELTLPYIYPTTEGGLQVEWDIEEQDISLEINLLKHTAEWHRLNLVTNEDENSLLNLDKSDDWGWINAQIEQYQHPVTETLITDISVR